MRRRYADWDNVRAADDWAHASGETEIALRLAAALWWWWSRPDLQTEGRIRLGRVLCCTSRESGGQLNE